MTDQSIEETTMEDVKKRFPEAINLVEGMDDDCAYAIFVAKVREQYEGHSVVGVATFAVNPSLIDDSVALERFNVLRHISAMIAETARYPGVLTGASLFYREAEIKHVQPSIGFIAKHSNPENDQFIAIASIKNSKPTEINLGLVFSSEEAVDQFVVFDPLFRYAWDKLIDGDVKGLSLMKTAILTIASEGVEGSCKH